MKIALAQINSTVGDIQGNLSKVIEGIQNARERGASIVAFPEMVITGYPPHDLLYETAFLQSNKRAALGIANETKGIVVILGFVDFDEELNLYNAAAIFEDGELIRIVRKTLLPTYDVFDEERYFEPGEISEIHPTAITVGEDTYLLGVEICEDLWDEEYETKVTDLLCSNGAQLVINISASPFRVGKKFERYELAIERAKLNEVPIFFVNLVGGQDELVFDGQSFAVDAEGRMISSGAAFEEDLLIVEFNAKSGLGHPISESSYEKEEEMYNALTLGIRDYFRKTGFKKAVLGLSGGIDSSLTACIAVDALGPENVIGVSMPSKFSSDHSKSDAEALASNLGVKYIQVAIHDVVDVFHKSTEESLVELRKHFEVDISQDDPVADENIQPRVRGNILMDYSNRLKDLRILVLNTGNKTELALGYCTLYGDMTGGVGVIGDVSKIEVYKLSEYVNRREGREIIPQGSITKKPSAELKDDQFDPFDFDIVSPMVDEIVENRRGKQELIDMGYPEDLVDDVYNRVRRAEYKRWQAPPCIRITKKSFGIGWKMPIVNHYKG
ncbi:MAG: NAD+ synthase [Candidatus Thorarchaeota archaeon]|nr:NAD+ synthase [Candidatus Thorarchaeota archaeon]